MKLITGLFKPTDAFRTVGELTKTGLTTDELSLVSSAEEMPARSGVNLWFIAQDPET